jgi:hypothetical protein
MLDLERDPGIAGRDALDAKPAARVVLDTPERKLEIVQPSTLAESHREWDTKLMLGHRLAVATHGSCGNEQRRDEKTRVSASTDRSENEPHRASVGLTP